jgi:hypothetical protein
MAKLFIEELNDVINGFMPKSDKGLLEEYPDMPPLPKSNIPETMGYGTIEKIYQQPIEIEGILPSIQENKTIQSARPVGKEGISSDLLEELKKYQGQPQTIEQTASRSTSSYEPLLKDLEGKRAEPSWIDLAAMGLSTAIGAKYGQLGAAAVPAGKYGIDRAKEIDKRNQSLDDAMLKTKAEMARKQTETKKTLADKKVEIMGADGNAYLVPESFAIQRGLQAFKEGSFDKVKYVDSVGEERWARFDKKRGTYTATTEDLLAEKDTVSKSEQGKAERQKLAMSNKAVDDFIKPNSKSANSVEMLESMVSAADILSQGGPVGLGGVKSLIARGVFREVGVLTEQDVGRLGGDLSAYAQAQRFLGRLKSGTALQPEDVQDAYQLLRVVHARESERLKNYTKQYIQLKSPVADEKILGGLTKFTQSLVEPLPKLGSQKVNLPTRQRNAEAAQIDRRARLEGNQVFSSPMPDGMGGTKKDASGREIRYLMIQNSDGTKKVLGIDNRR